MLTSIVRACVLALLFLARFALFPGAFIFTSIRSEEATSFPWYFFCASPAGRDALCVLHAHQAAAWRCGRLILTSFQCKARVVLHDASSAPTVTFPLSCFTPLPSRGQLLLSARTTTAPHYQGHQEGNHCL